MFSAAILFFLEIAVIKIYSLIFSSTEEKLTTTLGFPRSDFLDFADECGILFLASGDFLPVAMTCEK